MSSVKIFLVLTFVFVLVFIAFKVIYKQPETDPPFHCATCDREMSETEDTTPSEGRTLFKAKCAACHNASNKRSTGPGLMDVLSRIPSKEWAYGFIANADSMIKSGDAYAVKIFTENQNSPHVRYGTTLSKKEIDLILDYCDGGPAERKANKSGKVVD
jgi:cytochrome c2